MRALSFWSIDRPRTVFAIFGLLLAIALPGLLRLHFRLDGLALVPPGDPAVELDQRVRERFGLHDQLVVYVESPERPDGPALLGTAELDTVKRLATVLADQEAIGWRHLRGLSTEARDRVDSFDTSPFLAKIPQSERELREFKADVEALSPPILGTFVGLDFGGSAILIDVPEGLDREQLFDQVEALLASFDARGSTLHLVGPPAAEVLLGRHLLADLATLLPLTLLLIALALWWAFRRPWSIVLPLAEVGSGIVFTFGMLGWSGQPVYLTTAVLPVLLTTLGLTDEVHLLAACRRLGLERKLQNGRELARAVMQELAWPITLTSLTTAVGFFSFLASDLRPVGSFGLWASVGVIYCLLWSLMVTPAIFGRIRPDQLYDPGQEGSRSIPEQIDRWTALASQPKARRWAAVVLVVVFLGTLRLQIQDGWLSGFAAGSNFRISMDKVNEQLYGTHLLRVEVDFPSAPRGEPTQGPLMDPEVIRVLGRLEQQLAKGPQVGGVLGPASHLAAAFHVARSRPKGPREPPKNFEMTRRMWRWLQLGMGEERRREVVTDDMRSGLITVFLRDANFADTRQLLVTLREFEQKELTPIGAKVAIAGDVAVSQAMIAAIVPGQLKSLTWAVVGIFFILLAIRRSWKEALLAIVPAAMASIVSLGLMGWLGIPLGIATSMFLAITLGIGVDYPLHLLEARDRARAEGAERPLEKARRAVGPAIVIDTIAVVLGFGILAISQIPANARLGLIVATTIFTACCLTLLLFRDPDPASKS